MPYRKFATCLQFHRPPAVRRRTDCVILGCISRRRYTQIVPVRNILRYVCSFRILNRNALYHIAGHGSTHVSRRSRRIVKCNRLCGVVLQQLRCCCSLKKQVQSPALPPTFHMLSCRSRSAPADKHCSPLTAYHSGKTLTETRRLVISHLCVLHYTQKNQLTPHSHKHYKVFCLRCWGSPNQNTKSKWYHSFGVSLATTVILLLVTFPALETEKIVVFE